MAHFGKRKRIWLLPAVSVAALKLTIFGQRTPCDAGQKEPLDRVLGKSFLGNVHRCHGSDTGLFTGWASKKARFY
jgi:hypothetical protein